MSDYTYIRLTKVDGSPCMVESVAGYLTIALPSLGAAYQDTKLHLQIRWSSDNVSTPLEAVNTLDTGASDDAASKVTLFDGNTWLSMPEHGFNQDYAGCRVLVNTKSINPDSLLYYSWYYVENGITIHVTPWVSTRLTATAGIPKHSELQDRYSADQHSISSITGLQEALSKDYQEVSIHTDTEMQDIAVSTGKILTFVGYSTGEPNGCVVMRYKTADGTFGTLTPGITATLQEDNLIIEDQVTESGESGDTADLEIYVEDDILNITGTSANVINNILNLNSNSASVNQNILETEQEPSLAETEV
jgi:hypothetical protein